MSCSISCGKKWLKNENISLDKHFATLNYIGGGGSNVQNLKKKSNFLSNFGFSELAFVHIMDIATPYISLFISVKIKFSNGIYFHEGDLKKQ